MKKICMILMTLGIIMGCATAATAHAQEAENAKDTVEIFGAPYANSTIHCEINQIFYVIDSTRTYATAVWGNKKGPVLEIPSSVNIDGVQFPVTNFDNGINHEGFYKMDPSDNFKSYEEIKLPDSVLAVKIDTTDACKKINIPKHAKISSLQIDIDEMTIEVPDDHDYYTLKDNFVYDKKDNTKIYYVLGASGNVQIPEGVEYVGKLLKNSKIEKISLPSTLKRIGINFARSTEIKTVDLSGTKLEEIPEKAFLSSKLQSVKLPRTLRSINRRAFESCNLEKVTIPGNVTRIKAYAFGGCSKLQKITLGKKVEKIADGAFMDTGIREITFPASVKIVYSGILGGNNKLRKVTFLHKKKLPYFSGTLPMIRYDKPNNKKVTFCVKNQKIKSGLNKKLKKEKLKSKEYNVPGIRKWQIKVK